MPHEKILPQWVKRLQVSSGLFQFIELAHGGTPHLSELEFEFAKGWEYQFGVLSEKDIQSLLFFEDDLAVFDHHLYLIE